MLVTYPLDIIKTRLQIQGEQIQVKNELALKNAKLLKYGMFGTAMNMGENFSFTNESNHLQKYMLCFDSHSCLKRLECVRDINRCK